MVDHHGFFLEGDHAIYAARKEAAEKRPGASSLHSKKSSTGLSAAGGHISRLLMNSGKKWSHGSCSKGSIDRIRSNHKHPRRKYGGPGIGLTKFGRESALNNAPRGSLTETAGVDATTPPRNEKTLGMSSPVPVPRSTVVVTENDSTFAGKSPFPYRGILPPYEPHEFNKLPYPTSAMIIPYPNLTHGSTQLPVVTNPMAAAGHSYFPDSGQNPSSSRGVAAAATIHTRKRNARHKLLSQPLVIADTDQMAKSKRTKTVSNASLGFKVPQISGPGAPGDAVMGDCPSSENHIDLDLSLHL